MIRLQSPDGSMVAGGLSTSASSALLRHVSYFITQNCTNQIRLFHLQCTILW